MTRLHCALLLAAALLHGGASAAEERQSCEAAGGSYLTGRIVLGPKFTHGQYRKGVELSHTHLKVRADQDGRVYDVAIDNVFANGYRPGMRTVPPPLDDLRTGQRLSLCGQLYDRGVGIHFVHTNCGQAPSEKRPDGWIRVVGEHGTVGPNLEANGSQCDLFTSSRQDKQKRKPLHWTLH